jgi:hypothetical protein
VPNTAVMYGDLVSHPVLGKELHENRECYYTFFMIWERIRPLAQILL